MPTVLVLFGFTFFFYSLEHQPPHVHVLGKGGKAKFEWNGTTFVLKNYEKITPADLKKITKTINDNAAYILGQWHKHFGDDTDN